MFFQAREEQTEKSESLSGDEDIFHSTNHADLSTLQTHVPILLQFLEMYGRMRLCIFTFTFIHHRLRCQHPAQPGQPRLPVAPSYVYGAWSLGRMRLCIFTFTFIHHRLRCQHPAQPGQPRLPVAPSYVYGAWSLGRMRLCIFTFTFIFSSLGLVSSPDPPLWRRVWERD